MDGGMKETNSTDCMEDLTEGTKVRTCTHSVKVRVQVKLRSKRDGFWFSISIKQNEVIRINAVMFWIPFRFHINIISINTQVSELYIKSAKLYISRVIQEAAHTAHECHLQHISHYGMKM